MKFFSKKQKPDPGHWGLAVGNDGALQLGAVKCTDLADQFGTPLHVVDEAGLGRTADALLSAFTKVYPGNFSAHYAFKCNPVPGVINMIRETGFKAEVMSAFELALALRLGFEGDGIIVNGPYKPIGFLEDCLKQNVRLIIIDSLNELETLNRLAAEHQKTASVLLRINPDYVPKGMNSGTATGSRKGCAFGLDLEGGEAAKCLKIFKTFKNLAFQGFHFHMGTGIRYPEDYYHALCKLKNLVVQAQQSGLEMRIIDIGGGIAAPFSREMDNLELLYYTATNRLPDADIRPRPDFATFAEAVTRGIKMLFPDGPWPELIAEPGRSVAGPHQLLLLRVHQVKKRPGAGVWITTDGGIGTVTMPTYYEHHEVFLTNDVRRPRKQRVTINGPGCFAADQVYRNKCMPEVFAGEVLAVMDSGAYFTSWESNFGYPRPAVVAVSDGMVRLLRRRETLEEMMGNDLFEKKPE